MDDRNKVSLAICLRNAGAEDLIVRKIYVLWPDPAAEAKGFVRVVDESGEDYLYPADYFAAVDLTAELQHLLLEAV